MSRDADPAGHGIENPIPRRRADRAVRAVRPPVEPRDLTGPRVVVAALAVTFAGLTLLPAQAPEEVSWRPVSSGQSEIRLGEMFDLDFQNAQQSEPDFQFESFEGGSYFAPVRGATAALVGPAEFTAFDLGRADAIKTSRGRIYLCGGTEGAIAPGSVLIATTNEARFVKISIDGCGETLKFRWATFDRQLTRHKPGPGEVEAPVPSSPPDGISFEHDPRDLLLTWHSVSGAVSYTVELDCLGCCGPRHEAFCGDQENGRVYLTKTGLTTPAYYTVWIGTNPGRWRVAAVGTGGKPGPWSNWARFTFKKLGP